MGHSGTVPCAITSDSYSKSLDSLIMFFGVQGDTLATDDIEGEAPININHRVLQKMAF